MSGDGTSFDPRIVLRPRDLDEVLDLSLTYLRIHFRDVLRLFAAMTGVVFALSVVGWWGQDFQVGAAFAVALVLCGVSERVVTVFTGRHLFNHPVGGWTAIKLAFRKWPSLLLRAVLVPAPLVGFIFVEDSDSAWIALVVMAGMVWPFIVAHRLYTSEVVYLEQLSGRAAVKRATDLTKYRYGRALGTVWTSAALRAWFVVMTWTAARFLIEVMLQIQNADMYVELFAVLGYVASAPFLAVVRFFEYVDARTRQEGWDIQVRFRAIAQRDRERQAQRWAA